MPVRLLWSVSSFSFWSPVVHSPSLHPSVLPDLGPAAVELAVLCSGAWELVSVLQLDQGRLAGSCLLWLLLLLVVLLVVGFFLAAGIRGRPLLGRGLRIHLLVWRFWVEIVLPPLFCPGRCLSPAVPFLAFVRRLVVVDIRSLCLRTALRFQLVGRFLVSWLALGSCTIALARSVGGPVVEVWRMLAGVPRRLGPLR